MSQVQFLRGQDEDALRKVPLTPGAIFFTEATNHLYIDTDTARLPVKSDYVCGRVFWIKLLSTNWINDKQTVSIYYEDKTDTNIPALNTILTEDSIIFIGKSSYGTADSNGITPAVVAESSTENDITFRLLDIDGEGTIAPQQDIWIQLYCPNPKVKSNVPIDVFRSVFTTRIELSGNWSLDNISNKYYKIIEIPNIDFSTAPFLINLSDSSLENKTEFQEMIMEVTPEGNIKFISQKNIMFNIEVDICLFLALGLPGGLQVNDLNGKVITMGEWVNFMVANNENSSFTISAGALSNVPIGQERELLVFCTENNNADFAKIISIDYSTDETNPSRPIGNYTFTLADGEKITNSFNCVIIQLNNIANIREGTLQSNDTNEDGTQNPWTQVTSKMAYEGETLPDSFLRDPSGLYYYQYWPTGTEDSDLLKGKYMPLVMPKKKEDSILFSKICETKLYSNRIQFVIKGKDFLDFEHKDLDIRVIDFI